jgi:fumarate reductase flavoprotein subunit
LLVFGKAAGVAAARFAVHAAHADTARLSALAAQAQAQALAVLTARGGTERIATLRREMAASMDEGCGIYRTEPEMKATCDKLAELKQRCKRIRLDDSSRGWNTEWLLAIELAYQLDVAQAIAHSALERRESRGSHQRLDGFTERDDARYLKHTLARYNGDDAPTHRVLRRAHHDVGTRGARVRRRRREGATGGMP